jgi:acetylornithine deacetylase
MPLHTLQSAMLTDLLHHLVSVNSINPDLVPGAPGEGEVAAVIAEWLARHGLAVTISEPKPGRPNVVGLRKGSGGGRTLLLNGHTDTVGVAGMAEPFKPRLADGRLYGRGAYDMKAGLAAAMVAAAQAGPTRGDVIVAAVMDEEFAGLGTEALAGTVKADAAIVCEPTEQALVVAHKGFAWFEIETHGVAAHGSLPELGVDAIVKMGPVLQGLQALQDRLKAGRAHPLVGPGSIHASLIRGGQEWSSYPERCTVSIERRFIPGESPEMCEAELRSLLEQCVMLDPGFSARLHTGGARGPLETDPDAPIAQAVRAHGQAVLGAEIPVIGAPYWTDAQTLAAAGIPSVLFGPSGAGAHAVEEWVDLDSVAQCAQIYRRLIEAFCQ